MNSFGLSNTYLLYRSEAAVGVTKGSDKKGHETKRGFGLALRSNERDWERSPMLLLLLGYVGALGFRKQCFLWRERDG